MSIGIDESKIASTQTRLDALRSGNVNSELNIAREDLVSWRGIDRLVNDLGSIEEAELETNFHVLAAKEKEQSKVSEDAFSSAGVIGSTNQSWRDFIESGEKYSNEHLGQDYPAIGLGCAYCLQPLGEQAVRQIEMYYDFLNGKIVEEIRGVRKRIDEQLASVFAIDISPLVAWIQSRMTTEEAAGHPSESLMEVQELLNERKNLQAPVSYAVLPAIKNLKSLARKVRTIVLAELATAEEATERLSGEASKTN